MPVEANRGLHGYFADRPFPRLPAGVRRDMGQYSAKSRSCPLPKFLKIVLLSAAILIALCVKGDAQETLSAAEIKDQIVGHNFQGKKGILSVSLYYGNDGTVTMRSPLGTGTGSWALSSDRLCIKLDTGPRKVDECLTFMRQADGTYRTSNGMRLTPVK